MTRITPLLSAIVTICLLGNLWGCGSDDDVSQDAAMDLPGDLVADANDVSSDTSGLATSLCACLLVSCHDPFHDAYGELDGDAVPACQVEARTLPSNGSDVQSGNFIECRLVHCEMASTDLANCQPALGAAPCQ